MVELLLDMNDDCVEHVLKRCDPDSIVAVSQTCRKLKTIATRLFKNHTKYDGEIASREDETRVKGTIGSIGNNLVELNVNVAKEYETLDSIFFDRLPQKCQRLQILRVASHVSPNVVLGSADTLHQLQHLSIRCLRVWVDEDINELAVIGLARQLTQLQSFDIGAVHWNNEIIEDFLREARNLKRFSCYVDGIPFEADHDFLETFRFSENPAATLNLRFAELQIYQDDFSDVIDDFADDDDLDDFNDFDGYESPSDIDDDYPSDIGDEED